MSAAKPASPAASPMIAPRAAVLAAMIVAAAISRLVPHPWNLTSVTALALFGGASFADRRAAIFVPLAAMALSDLALGFYSILPVVYLSFVMIAGIGMWLRKRRHPALIVGAALASSLLFYATTNFAVWAVGHLYPRTLAGLGQCYVNALPFLRNGIEGDLLYSLLLFGGFALLERRFAILREAPPLPAFAG